MQLFPKEGKIIIRAEYSPSFIKQIKQVPGAENVGWEWRIPEENVPLAIQTLNLTDAHLFPYLQQYIDKTALQGVQVCFDENTEEVVAKAPVDKMEYLKTNITILCGFEQVTDRNVKGKGRVFERNYVTPIKDMEQDGPVLRFKMPIGLVPRLASFLNNFPDTRFLYKNRKNPPKPSLDFKPIPKDVEVREYQVSILVAAPKKRMATIVLPTGAGKTITSALVTHELKTTTLFLTYSSMLLYQTKKAYEKVLGVPVGIIGDGNFEIQDVTIATVQSILSVLSGEEGFEEIAQTITSLKRAKFNDLDFPVTAEKKTALINFLSKVQLLWTDEGHGLGSRTIYTAARLCRPYYSYALTATPFRTDNKEIYIEAACGPNWRPVTEEELIKQGYVLPVKVAVAPYQHPTPNRLSSRRDSAKLYTRAITANEARNQLIVKLARLFAKKHKTLVLVKEIAHGIALAEALETTFICAETPEAEKQQIFKDFTEGKIRILVSSPILEQGVDLPSIGLLLDATPRKSPIKILQSIGRARRPAPGKTHAYVVTIYDHDKGVYEKQSVRKLDILKQANFEIVPFGKKSTETKVQKG